MKPNPSKNPMETEIAATDSASSTPSISSTTSTGTLVWDISPDCLIPSPDNPRRIPKNWRRDPGLLELAQSIKTHGVLQPLLARPMPDDSAVRPGGQLYDLLSGHRRLLAAQIAGLATVPVLVSEVTDSEALEITVTENLQREDLHPLEESKGVAALLRVMTAFEAADHLGRTVSWVARRAKLQDLTKDWIATLDDPDAFPGWTAYHYERIARFSKDVQNAILADLDRNHWKIEGSGRGLDAYLSDYLHLVHKAPWKMDDELLEPRAGACSNCPKRSSLQPELFEELQPEKGKTDPTDRCLDARCWESKTVALVQRKHQDITNRDGKKPLLLTEERYSPTSPTGKYVSGLTEAPLQSYQVQRVKQSERGAVLALHVDGPAAGKTVWVRPNSWAAGPARQSKPKSDAPVPLADRRAALQKRRNVLAINRLRENIVRNLAKGTRPLEAAELPSVLETLIWANEIGMSERLPHNVHIERPEQEYAGIPAEMGDVAWELENKQLQRLFRDLAGVLAAHIAGGSSNLGEAGRIAKFLRWEVRLEEFIRDAAEKIPEPKLWAALNDDGTPRKRPPKTPKSTSPTKSSSSSGSTSYTTDDPTLRNRLALRGTPEPQPYPMAHESNSSCAVGRLSHGPEKENAPPPSKPGLRPNKHGVFEEDDCEKVILCSSPRGSAEVTIAQMENGKWVTGYVIRFGRASVGDGSMTGPASINNHPHYDDRQTALESRISWIKLHVKDSASKSAPKLLKEIEKRWPTLPPVRSAPSTPDLSTSSGAPGQLKLASPVPADPAPMAMACFLDRQARILFVSDGISNGKSWATYYRKPNGSLKRVVSANLPQCKSAARALSDLELYGQIHKLERGTHP